MFTSISTPKKGVCPVSKKSWDMSGSDPLSSKLPLWPIGCLVIRGQRSVAIEAAGIHAGPTPTQGVAVAPLAALVAIVDGIPGIRKQSKTGVVLMGNLNFINHWSCRFDG